ncbi:MAG: hypothetical protein IJR87_08645 [Bacteroidaceae bacterium]|nr:hypothetical protein [Bacteroidaceae bacterium]
MDIRKYAITAAIIAVAILYGRKMMTVERLQENVDRLSVELARARTDIRRDTIRDSIEVVEQVVVEVAPKKLKDALAADEQLIKELKLKVRQLEALQTTTIETSDTVPATHKQADSLFYYSDLWADIRLSLKDTTFYYNIRDSLSTLVYREYRHHFLWWRWGTKGYRLKIVNFNPHARVTYSKYIKAGK